MTAYYPSQAGYPVSQPVGMPMAQPYGVPGSYAHAGGVIQPGVVSAVPTVGAPVVMQPSYNGGYGYDHHSWGNRVRRFLGLAPSANVRYKHDRSTWGFMGYSRRQRYIDARTGGEVDRQGRPVYRI